MFTFTLFIATIFLLFSTIAVYRRYDAEVKESASFWTIIADAFASLMSAIQDFFESWN